MRRIFDISGIVQGVGFRPAVFRAAKTARLAGWIQNRSGCVRLVLEGRESDITEFIKKLPESIPFNSRIDSISEVPPVASDHTECQDGFFIKASRPSEEQRMVIPADLAICADCRREMFDPSDRRYRHPFITCTQCGPRYTVIADLPYDRERTSMNVFPMCENCRKEYENPGDRRFHAESIACPECGPKLWLENTEGGRIAGDPIHETRKALHAGKIVAIRGLGGYLLAVNAFDARALRELRNRKRRPHKPFAVMAKDMAVLETYCNISDVERRMLRSPASPIVVADLQSDTGSLPANLITPDTLTMGVMLPNTPLQTLLFEGMEDDSVPDFELLVMTSGNKRGEPICITNNEARERLGAIADLFLMHNREILLRCDDSLCAVSMGKPAVWRRARGFAPLPTPLPATLKRNILALGAEQKNAVAFGYDNETIISPHVGDLDTPEAMAGFDSVVAALPVFLKKTPDIIAVDMHPDMHSVVYGKKLAEESGVQLLKVQHHHAHGMACLAENGRLEGLALVFDGTGLGSDSVIWGAELLDIRGAEFKRLATFLPVSLPGGDAAVLEPARQLVARWFDAGINVSNELCSRLGITMKQAEVWIQQCRSGLNAPLSHAAGRLFDSFSTLLGQAPERITYDGQPAVRLEALARHATRNSRDDIKFKIEQNGDLLQVDWRPLFRAIEPDILEKDRGSGLAMGFHIAVADAALAMAEYGMSRTPFRSVALSGGVFMNKILEELVVESLEQKGVKVLRHSVVPTNDGGIAFGQAVISGKL